jgi:cytochrome c
MLALRLVVLLLGLRAFSTLPPATPEPPDPTPTVDRLAAPPTAASPNQADTGAQLYWLHCQPCHGDQAQGLTDEWRAQYPSEDQNCWNSGCHGQQPYANGFILPTQVPALVGAGTLNRFATASDLHNFISRAMPFQAPASLEPDEYWSITAFLLRGHGLPDTALPITSELQAQQIPLGASTPVANPNPGPGSQPAEATAAMLVVVFGVAGLVAAGGLVLSSLKRRRG